MILYLSWPKFSCAVHGVYENPLSPDKDIQPNSTPTRSEQISQNLKGCIEKLCPPGTKLSAIRDWSLALSVIS